MGPSSWNTTRSKPGWRPARRPTSLGEPTGGCSTTLGSVEKPGRVLARPAAGSKTAVRSRAAVAATSSRARSRAARMVTSLRWRRSCGRLPSAWPDQVTMRRTGGIAVMSGSTRLGHEAAAGRYARLQELLRRSTSLERVGGPPEGVRRRVARPTNGVGVDQQPASDLAAKRAGRPAARRRYVPVAAKFVVVVDNGSTDGTRAVAEAYGAATGLRVRCIEERRPGAIGEDIVLTWRLMRQGARVYYEPSAVAFTAAPTRLVHLARQRARWARGMIEGIRSVKPWSRRAGCCASSPPSTCSSRP